MTTRTMVTTVMTSRVVYRQETVNDDHEVRVQLDATNGSCEPELPGQTSNTYMVPYLVTNRIFPTRLLRWTSCDVFFTQVPYPDGNERKKNVQNRVCSRIPIIPFRFFFFFTFTGRVFLFAGRWCIRRVRDKKKKNSQKYV